MQKLTARLQLWLLVFSHALLALPVSADVVKPALIEINADSSGELRVEIRASVEALLTGINARYKNTQESPRAAQYDALRKLTPRQLKQKFERFESELLGALWLRAGQRDITLSIESLTIPPPGYLQVPRISELVLRARLPADATELQLYYPAAFGESAIRLKQIDQSAQQWHWSEWQWIRNDQPSEPFSLTEVFSRPAWHQSLREYIGHGFAHIVPRGADHLLFILGLFFFSPRLRPLFWQVTMFTLAHSLTLGLSMLDIIHLPARVVEPLIALSIVWIAVENIFQPKLSRARLAVVFVFGLLHGLGFARMLADFDLPAHSFIATLVGFNIGVEIAQLAVLLLAYLLLARCFSAKAWYRQGIVIPASLGIAATGLFWAVERL